MRIPARYLVHTAQVRPYLGRSSTGPVYGDAFTLKCMAQGGVRMVRNASGAEVVSSLTLYAAPEDADRVPPGSEVTWDNPRTASRDTTTVLQTIAHDSGGLGAPDHTEVVCE